MRPLLATALVLLMAAAATADDKFESKDGKYTATFPGKPKTLKQKTGEIDLVIDIVEKGTGGFAVIYSDLPAAAVKATKPKMLLDGGEMGLVNNFKAKVTSSKDFEFGKEKYPARRIVGEKDNVSLRITLVLVENRLYQVFVAGPKDTVNGKDADKFIESFEITK